MSNGFDKLKSIGAQKIHEQTHIARHHAQAILHESFDDMTKIQLLGFISILERDYHVDLTTLKTKVDEFFSAETVTEEQDIKVFVSPKKKKSYTLFYLLIAVLIFVIAVFFTLDSSSNASVTAKVHPIDNIAIENAKETIRDSEAQNATIEDKNSTIVLVEEQPEPIEEVKSFKIMPKSQLWIGYIDLSTHKKYQKLFTGKLEIDPTKNWILTLGHGYVNIEINGEVTEFKEKLNIRLLYKDSKLSKIDFKEFKELNRGNKW